MHIAIILPSVVTGYISPYPTVRSVDILHHIPLKALRNISGCASYSTKNINKVIYSTHLKNPPINASSSKVCKNVTIILENIVIVINISKVLLITDMDGTFLPASKIPTPKTLAAVKRFEEAGGRFSIATGRAIQAARQYFDMVNVNCPIIMSNGGMVYDIHTKEQIYNVFLPSFAADIVKEILVDNPYVGCEVLTVNEVYVPSMTPMEKRHNEICKLIPVPRAVDEIPDKNWYKVLFAVEPERMDELINYVAKKGYKGVDFVRSSIEYYEILPQNISKGTALEELRKACGMDDFTFVAAGDYNNDIELLQAADVAYCPSNAAEEVKKVADKVFEQSCEEDFIAAVIDEIFEKLKK